MSTSKKSHSEKDQSDITSLCEIDVENGFRDHSHSLDKIRHLISIELQLMKKKLGNLQLMFIHQVKLWFNSTLN
ncbi:Atg11p [Echinococcus multilocularis]|uniref:Atg11p n=1 Tax=Echinococcus multilocularis TaxID=6211 RepID=A0A0S4MMV0_ECHMU|nr:Atg11p [Echinococcus multilocularis]